MYLLNTLCKHSQCRVETVCEPLDLITGWPSFGSNNLNQMFSDSQEEFWTIPLYKTLSVKQYSWGCLWTALEVMPQHLNRVEVRTLTGPLQKAHCLLLLIYFCVLGCCPVASPNFCWASIGRQPYILLQNVLITMGINFSVWYSSKLSRPWGSKAAQTMMLPPPYFTVGMRFWCWCAVPFFRHT